MAGHKTSIYLTDELAGRVRASGLQLPELIRRGLEAGAPAPLEEVIRRVVREELAAWAAEPAVERRPECRHPVESVVDGVCRACGADVF